MSSGFLFLWWLLHAFVSTQDKTNNFKGEKKAFSLCWTSINFNEVNFLKLGTMYMTLSCLVFHVLNVILCRCWKRLLLFLQWESTVGTFLFLFRGSFDVFWPQMTKTYIYTQEQLADCSAQPFIHFVLNLVPADGSCVLDAFVIVTRSATPNLAHEKKKCGKIFFYYYLKQPTRQTQRQKTGNILSGN